MNLKQFADKAKLKIIPYKEGYGNFAYIDADTPHCTFFGYKTENSARKGWLVNTVGKSMAKAILSLLDK
jgi:hypothetical protein